MVTILTVLAMAELHWGQGGHGPPLANENPHCVNSKTATVHYCSKRVASLILLELEVKLRQCVLGVLQALRTFTMCDKVKNNVMMLTEMTILPWSNSILQ